MPVPLEKLQNIKAFNLGKLNREILMTKEEKSCQRRTRTAIKTKANRTIKTSMMKWVIM